MDIGYPEHVLVSPYVFCYCIIPVSYLQFGCLLLIFPAYLQSTVINLTSHETKIEETLLPTCITKRNNTTETYLKKKRLIRIV